MPKKSTPAPNVDMVEMACPECGAVTTHLLARGDAAFLDGYVKPTCKHSVMVLMDHFLPGETYQHLVRFLRVLEKPFDETPKKKAPNAS